MNRADENISYSLNIGELRRMGVINSTIIDHLKLFSPWKFTFSIVEEKRFSISAKMILSFPSSLLAFPAAADPLTVSALLAAVA